MRLLDVEMDFDVEAIARRLKEQVLTASEERQILAVIRRWAATPEFDRFLTKLRIRAVTRATARSAWRDATVNLFDTLFQELEDDRLVEFEQLLTSSRRYAGATPESAPSENVWGTVGREELIGLFGMMKGLSAGLAGIGDVAVWTAVKQANLYLAPFGLTIEDPGSVAGWVEKQLDVSGDFLFDGGFTGGEELISGQNAATIGKAGGSIIWNLVMLHGGSGAASVTKPGLSAALKAHDVVAAFKGVDDAIVRMGDYLLRMQEAGKLDREHLLGDDEFKVEAFVLAGALTGAVGQALGLGGDKFAEVIRTAMDKLGTLFKVGEIGAKLGRISQILMDDSLTPEEQRKAVGDIVIELVSEAFTATGGMAAAVDKTREERRRQRKTAAEPSTSLTEGRTLPGEQRMLSTTEGAPAAAPVAPTTPAPEIAEPPTPVGEGTAPQPSSELERGPAHQQAELRPAGQEPALHTAAPEVAHSSGKLEEWRLLGPGPTAVPETEATRSAATRVTGSATMLSGARDAAAAARSSVATAKADLDAAQRRVEASPGDRLARASLRKANKALAAAQSELRRAAASEALANVEVTSVVRAAREIERLETLRKDLRDRMHAELHPKHGFSVEEERSGRKRGIIPLAEPRLQPSGRRYHELAAMLKDANARLTVEIGLLRYSISEQVARATPGAKAKPIALANAAALSEQLRPKENRPIDITTGVPITTHDWETDHIMSRHEIAADRRFLLLTPRQRQEILLQVPENYLPVTGQANRSKGTLRMDEWIAARQAAGNPLPEELIRALRDADKRARGAVEERFKHLLGH